MSRRALLLVAVLAALLQAAAAPPAALPGAELLLLPGLALQFGVARSPRVPLFGSYLLGALYMLLISWSLRHVLVVGVVGIALLGGCYFVLAAAAVRALPRAPVFAFAVAVAAACWLRAEMPEIPYPHAQPCHVFWRQPWLLGAVRLGGEPLGNALLAWLGATLWQLGRAWRVGDPPWRVAQRRALVALGTFAALAVLGSAPSVPVDTATVDVAAIEPGVHPTDPFVGGTSGPRERVWQQVFEERLLAPTIDVAGPRATDPPDLVLWPESSVSWPVDVDASGRARFTALQWLHLHDGTRLCFGGGVDYRDDGERDRAHDVPAAVLVDARGRYLGHQDKRVRVPGGEYLPFLDVLPDAIADWLRAQVVAGVGYAPAVPPGRPQPLLHTAGDVPFGAMVCYDNAFHGPVAAEVAAGARFLVVLSNEAWYRGGGELQQLAAITVVRALACGVPIVRCTTDGLSLAVDAGGRVLAELPLRPAPQPAAGILRVQVPLGAGHLPPMAAWHPRLGAAAAVAVLLWLLHALWTRATLPRLDRPAADAAGAATRHGPPEGGS